jgi:hypothetical protein
MNDATVLVEELNETMGWLPFTHNADIHFYESRYFQHFSYFQDEVLRILELVEKYDTRLAIVFSPFPYDETEQTRTIQTKMEALDKKHDNLEIPFKFITTWPHEYFGDNIHLNPKGSVRASHRLGKALKLLLEK